MCVKNPRNSCEQQLVTGGPGPGHPGQQRGPRRADEPPEQQVGTVCPVLARTWRQNDAQASPTVVWWPLKGPAVPILSVHLRRVRACAHTETCPGAFITARAIMPQSGNEPGVCQQANGWAQWPFHAGGGRGCGCTLRHGWSPEPGSGCPAVFPRGHPWHAGD